ncbi:Nicotinate phosphoribosyltransferase [compost metagenome]
MAHITQYCKGKIGHSFGVGTNFTNDVGLTQMNIVIKMTETQPEDDEWTQVIKLSDEPKKNTGDPATIKLAKQILMIHD